MIPVPNAIPEQRAWPRATGWRGRLATLGLLGGGALLVVWSGIPVCPTATLFGIPCPGCGLTRASLLLLSGDVHGALGLHPLVFVLLPLISAALAWGAASYLRGTRQRAPSASRGGALSLGAGLLLVLMLGVWGLRFAGYFGGPVPIERSLIQLRR